MVITEKKLPSNKVAADASSIERTMVKIVEIVQKPIFLTTEDLQGKWMISSLTNITEEELKSANKQPFLQFTGNNVSGNNGCNSIRTSINETINKNTFKVGLIMETKMFCKNMKVSNAVNQLLVSSVSFLYRPTEVILLNKEKQQTMVLKKEE
jgi:heat shock protein HslJ